MANWGELIITSLSSGTVVAIVNHYLQLSRRKKEIIFENKSTLIREKMKNFYNVNKELNEIVISIADIEDCMSDYQAYSSNANNEKLREKFENMKEIIESSQEKMKNCLKTLDSNLVFFPKIQDTINVINLGKRLFDIYEDFQKLKRINKLPFEESATQRENKIFADLLMSYSSFSSACETVIDVLNQEGNKIYKYLDDEK